MDEAVGLPVGRRDCVFSGPTDGDRADVSGEETQMILRSILSKFCAFNNMTSWSGTLYMQMFPVFHQLPKSGLETGKMLELTVSLHGSAVVIWRKNKRGNAPEL